MWKAQLYTWYVNMYSVSIGVRFHRDAIRKRSLRSLLGEIITNKKAEKHGFKK